MKIAELIKVLEKYPQDLEVAHPQWSEHRITTEADIQVGIGCPPRPDGWVHDLRPDMAGQSYLIIG